MYEDFNIYVVAYQQYINLTIHRIKFMPYPINKHKTALNLNQPTEANYLNQPTETVSLCFISP